MLAPARAWSGVEALDDLARPARVGHEARRPAAAARAHGAVLEHHDAAADLGQARDAARHVVVVDADHDDVVRVVGDGRRERAAAQAEAAARSPRPTRPVAWWRSTTAILARSRAGSATTRRRARVGSSSRRVREQLRRARARSRARAPRSSRTRRSPAASGAMLHAVAHPVRDLRARRTAPRAPSLGDHAAVLEHERRRERAEVVEQHEVGAVARARSRRGRAARGRAPGGASPAASASSGATPSAHGHAAHLVDVALAQQHVGLAVVGAERAALGPVARARAAAGRAGCARSTPRGSAPTRRGGASRAPPPSVVASWSVRDAGGEVRVERRAADAGRVAVDVPPGASASFASSRSSPAMTAGKFIISAMPSARAAAQDRRACRRA